MEEQDTLVEKIISVLKDQGFRVNPHVEPQGDSKAIYKRVQEKARLEQISKHRKFLQSYTDTARKYCRDGRDIAPERISLELREVKSGSSEEALFRWWNFIWWSVPYQLSYGRQMRFLLWDTTHDSPFGLIGLKSPVLSLSVRDKSLGIPREELDLWVNRSMSAQRVGALPPYNEILGGKMVAIALTCNEIRRCYRAKYKDYVSIIKGRKLKADLLFITTTSAFGRSSLYNRLKYNDEVVAESLGYTRGSGTFHIPEDLYEEIVQFLASKGFNVARGYGHGPSRKLKLISHGLRLLGLSSFEYHGIEREFYLFPLAENLREVIQCGQEPLWVDRPFSKLLDYWKQRWAIPRAMRMPQWKEFTVTRFFREIDKMFEELEGR